MKAVKTISTLALAFLVLLASSNFMLGIHLCSGEIQDVAFLTKAQACEMEQKLPPCHRHLPAPCCEDETIQHERQDMKTAITQFNFAGPVAIEPSWAPVVIAEIIPSDHVSRTRYLSYDPPLPWLDITISNQVLLI